MTLYCMEGWPLWRMAPAGMPRILFPGRAITTCKKNKIRPKSNYKNEMRYSLIREKIGWIYDQEIAKPNEEKYPGQDRIILKYDIRRFI